MKFLLFCFCFFVCVFCFCLEFQIIRFYASILSSNSLRLPPPPLDLLSDVGVCSGPEDRPDLPQVHWRPLLPRPHAGGRLGFSLLFTSSLPDRLGLFICFGHLFLMNVHGLFFLIALEF